MAEINRPTTPEMESGKPGRLWAYVAIVTGAFLLLNGLGAAAGFLGLPFLLDDDLLGPQLGATAGLFLGLVGGGLAFYHGLNSLRRRSSSAFKLPPLPLLAVTFAALLGLGNVLLNFHVAEAFLFPPIFLLSAAVPTLGVLSYAGRRLDWPITWRQAALAMVAAGTLSTAVVIVLSAILPLLAMVILAPIEILAYFGPDSAGLLFFLIFVAIQAPIPEEFAKALGPWLMRSRIRSERQAFMIGLAAGAGFAILENMLYEGLYATQSGWEWGGVTLLRGIGVVLHPIGTGIISLALFRARGRPPGWFRNVALAYLAAVGLHTLWNGGFEALVFLTGLDPLGSFGGEVMLYGERIAVVLVAYLVLLALGLWWLLRWVLSGLVGREPAPLVTRDTPVPARAMAVWALLTMLLAVSIGLASSAFWR